MLSTITFLLNQSTTIAAVNKISHNFWHGNINSVNFTNLTTSPENGTQALRWINWRSSTGIYLFYCWWRLRNQAAFHSYRRMWNLFSAFDLCPEEVVSSRCAVLGNDVVNKPHKFKCWWDTNFRAMTLVGPICCSVRHTLWLKINLKLQSFGMASL